MDSEILDIIKSFDYTVLFIVLEYIVITYILGMIYKFIGWKNSTYIQRNFGWTGYCILGSVGVSFHELAHLITAVLFRHRINRVELFRPVKGKIDGVLGYVYHTWNNRSIYQRIGNFFIGTAPMFFGAGFLFILLRFAYPTSFVEVVALNEIPDSLRFAFKSMFQRENFFTIWTPVVFLAVILICPHMHMSWADVKGATSGAVTLLIVALILSVASDYIPVNVMAQMQGAMTTFVTYYVYALILGLVINGIMTLCFGLLSLLRGRGL